jgi:hypothetical protein
MQRRRERRQLPDPESPADAFRPDEFAHAFDAEMQALPPSIDRVILSEERLSLIKSTEDIAALKAFLAPYFDQFTIVVYLRNQASYMASRYSEQLRLCSFEGPDNVVATPERLWHHDYHALIERWASVFGEAAITPRIYERVGGRNFDSVADFLAVCGVNLNMSEDKPPRVRNTSMTVPGQKLMLRLADMIKQRSGEDEIRYELWREISVSISAGVPGSGWLPTRAEAAAFMARFASSNEAVRQRYFPDRPSLFADDSDRFPIENKEPDPEAILNAACLSFLECAARLEKRYQANQALRAKGGGKRPGGKGRRGAGKEPDLHDDEDEE